MNNGNLISSLIARLRCGVSNHLPDRGRVKRDQSILFGHCTRCGKSITKIKGAPRWKGYSPTSE